MCFFTMNTPGMEYTVKIWYSLLHPKVHGWVLLASLWRGPALSFEGEIQVCCWAEFGSGAAHCSCCGWYYINNYVLR